MRIESFLVPFDVSLAMPGSKSHANRALVAACLADGETRLRCPQPAEDVRRMVRGLEQLGYAIHAEDDETFHVEGGVPEGAPDDAIRIDCGLAGTALRFLCAVAAITPGEWILTGNRRMRERPIGDLTAAIRQLGVEATDVDGCPPVRIKGRTPRGDRVTLDASRSSQFLSALLLIGAALPRGLTVELPAPPTSGPYVDLTAAVLRDFGVTLDGNGSATRFAVPPGGLRGAGGDYAIEGDWSAAGAWLVLERLLGGRFRGTNLRPESVQGDARLAGFLDRLDADGPVRIDVTPVPDQTMNLAVRAAFRAERTEFVGAANLRTKECDRLAATVAGLRAFGLGAEETPDGLIVAGGFPARSAAPPVHGDHRMAMAWAALGVAAGGVEIDEPGCVAKSYPRFFDDLEHARRHGRPIAVVGMRAVGKSTLARTLAHELKMEHVDTDEAFVAAHGPIADFVARHGWPEFRAGEAAIVDRALAPGHVIALGGGGIEAPGVSALLRDRALVVWLQETPETIEERIARRAGLRPSLTGADPVAEARAVLARREPLWRAVADLVLPPGGRRSARIEAVRRWLQGRPPRRVEATPIG